MPNMSMENLDKIRESLDKIREALWRISQACDSTEVPIWKSRMRERVLEDGTDVYTLELYFTDADGVLGWHETRVLGEKEEVAAAWREGNSVSGLTEEERAIIRAEWEEGE